MGGVGGNSGLRDGEGNPKGAVVKIEIVYKRPSTSCVSLANLKGMFGSNAVKMDATVVKQEVVEGAPPASGGSPRPSAAARAAAALAGGPVALGRQESVAARAEANVKKE